LGEGFARFGRYEASEEALNEASTLADANQIHQIAFKAQSALGKARSLPPVGPTFTPPPAWVPEDVSAVIRGISNLRKAAVAVA